MYKYLILLLAVSFTVSAQPEKSTSDALEVLTRDYSSPDAARSSNTVPARFTEASSTNSTGVLRGQLRPVNFTTLAAGIEGKLKTFAVRTGSTIEEGGLIASFACEQEEAENQIAAAKVKVAEKNFEINRKLDAFQNVSEVELSMSEAEVEIAKAEAKRTGAVVKNCSIRAPFNATVTEKMAQAHQYVKKGDPLLEIVDTENLEIEMVLSSVDVTRYSTGQRFSILIDETGQLARATINRVVNVIDPVSQTVRVIGVLDDNTSGLMPGMSGQVSFTAGVADAAQNY